jgi:hypothetical protein
MRTTDVDDVCDELEKQGVPNHEALCIKYRRSQRPGASLPPTKDLENLPGFSGTEIDQLGKAIDAVRKRRT